MAVLRLGDDHTAEGRMTLSIAVLADDYGELSAIAPDSVGRCSRCAIDS